jgi:ABC-type Zn2+ transport system substrate-binding protein/surface adhesin
LRCFPVFSHDGTRLQLTANDLDQLRTMSGMLTEEQNEQEEEEEEEEEHADDDTGPRGRQGHGDLHYNHNSHTSHVASSREQRAPTTQHQASSHQRPKLQNRQDLQPKRQQRESWSSRRTGTLGAFQVVSRFPVASLPQ